MQEIDIKLLSKHKCGNDIHKHEKTLQKFNQAIIIMGVHTGDNKFLKTIQPKTFHFDILKIFEKNVIQEIDSKLLSQYKCGNDIHELGKQQNE